MSAGLGSLKFYLRSVGIPFEEEFLFHHTRKWRFDIALPALRIAIEYDGHGATGGKGHIGRHASVTGMAGDCEKINQAQILGWRVLRFTALHFDATARRKNKLSPPLEIIELAIAGPPEN
jgi:hypothetical protein